MIPKIIHYCWFGNNPKSGLILSCIESWKKYLPDYKIIEWNENNFDVNCCSFVKQAYEMKKWAFVSDYARLWALYNFGGLYFDTDVEVLKTFDCFLDNEAFTGYESKDMPVTAVMGAVAKSKIFKYLMDYYHDKSFINSDGSMNMVTNTVIISDLLKEYGVSANGKEQVVMDMKIYPQIYFCPNNISRIWNKISSKSYAIHHFDQSWKSEKTEQNSFFARVRRYMLGVLRNMIGTNRVGQLSKIMKGLSNRWSILGKKE